MRAPATGPFLFPNQGQNYNCYALRFLKQNFYFNFTESYGSVTSTPFSDVGDFSSFLGMQPAILTGISLLLQENTRTIPQLGPRQLPATKIHSPVCIIMFVNVIHCCTNMKLQ